MSRIKNQCRSSRKSIIKKLKSYVWPQKKCAIPPADEASKKSIIFDMDGVICTTHSLTAFYEVGIFITLQYILEQWKIPSQNEFYKVIMSTPAKSAAQSFVTDTLRMPQIIVDWQCGLQSTENLQKAMAQHIQNKKNLTNIEKKFWMQVVSLKTIPERLIASRCVIPGGVELLHDLKYAGYNLYVISNWDSLSFPLLEKQFPEIFMHHHKKMFNDIIISGKIGIVKPDHIIFEKAISKFGIEVSDAVFIDDVIENVQAAEKIGIESIHCIKENMKHVRMHLASILKNKSK